jgi:hypothetical protein
MPLSFCTASQALESPRAATQKWFLDRIFVLIPRCVLDTNEFLDARTISRTGVRTGQYSKLCWSPGVIFDSPRHRFVKFWYALYFPRSHRFSHLRRLPCLHFDRRTTSSVAIVSGFLITEHVIVIQRRSPRSPPPPSCRDWRVVQTSASTLASLWFLHENNGTVPSIVTRPATEEFVSR